ncbi:TetR/AcrR family transcriptional repressor of nem operon [Kibdelosporangium banguiense]|uniref:TetR/AcrR family transcriptional repressor of nem operon n=1 Tax=Kibdelosporangium banguiense TaxID=1365924 RepID=A0ABS4T984_9PSEU|nr:helix-turn-helix domain-containing protein [Kibdelosporangium banguiense]MBP2320396.1 TetR/AcrR family transcriptional repressor of nem operon [Kibdelosporangium banguiense]
MEAAADLFARRAYDGVSIDDLVTRLGVHRNSLYGVFGSKRGLYLAALRRHIERDVRPQLTRMAQAEHAPAWDLLLVAAVDRASEDPEVADLVLSVFAELDEVTCDPRVTEALLGKWLRGRPGIGHRRANAPEGGGLIINDAPETAPRKEM